LTVNLFRVRWVTPKLLAVSGALAVLVGAVVTITFAILMSSNDVGSSLVATDGTVSGGAKIADPSLATNMAYLWGARVGYVVLALGAVLMVAAAITSTPRFSQKLESQS
jgi:hypothetical protein